MRRRYLQLLMILAGLGCEWACGSRTFLGEPYLEDDGAAAGEDGVGGSTGGRDAGLGGGVFGGTGGGGPAGGMGGSGGLPGFGGWPGIGGWPGVGGFAGGLGGFAGGLGGFAGNIFDALPIPDSGPIFDCAICAEQSCGTEVNACYQDPACAQGIVCAALNCGGMDINCMLGCFGDPAGMMVGVSAFMCLATSCGPDCIGALGPMGGAAPSGPSLGDTNDVPEYGAAPPPAGAATADGSDLVGPGGYLIELPQATAAGLGLEPAWMLVPSIEVIDTLPGVSGSCAEYGADCD